MLGVMECPECEEKMNVDLVREFTQVRCSNCGCLMDRSKHLSDAPVIVTKEKEKK